MSGRRWPAQVTLPPLPEPPPDAPPLPSILTPPPSPVVECLTLHYQVQHLELPETRELRKLMRLREEVGELSGAGEWLGRVAGRGGGRGCGG